MNSSRIREELDARVAHLIFKKEVERTKDVWTYEDWRTSDFPSARNAWGIKCYGDGEPPHLWVPKYSSDFKLAWDVWNKMLADGWQSLIHPGDSSKVVVEFFPTSHRHDDPLFSGEHVTLPTAICIAAVAACGESDKNLKKFSKLT